MQQHWADTRSIERISCLTRSTFSSVRVLRSLSLLVSLLTVQVSVDYFSSLLMLLFVHHLFENSFINSVALHPFNRCTFYQNLICVAETHVYKHYGDTPVFVA